jgi:hypothetical protein
MGVVYTFSFTWKDILAIALRVMEPSGNAAAKMSSGINALKCQESRTISPSVRAVRVEGKEEHYTTTIP